MSTLSRRHFLRNTARLSALSAFGAIPRAVRAGPNHSAKMKFGLVTYQWGKDMDLPTLIEACEQSGLLGVELRTEHRHRVEPSLSKLDRAEVRKRFDDSPVALVGYGSNAQFHENDPAKLKKNIELTKAYVQLMHDCGGTGVKVKPNSLPKDVPHEKTIEQIGNALNVVAAYGQTYGQQIRVEVHGRGTSQLPVIKAIFDVATHPNAGVCWNSNKEDLDGDGLDHNFNLVKGRFGDTVHVRELDQGDYPYENMFELFTKLKYSGWILLEARVKPKNPVEAMRRQRMRFEQLVRLRT